MATLTRELRSIITNAALANKVPVSLALAQARRESGFNTRARSRVGAVGLFQLMPFNAKGIDPYNARQNASRAMSIMRRHRVRFGSWGRALAAYVWGPAHVKARERFPADVKDYISDIAEYRKEYGSGVAWGVPIAATLGLAWWALKKR